jgi:hypothetical protein
MTQPNPTPTTIKERLGALVEAVLQSSKFNAAFIPVIKNLIKNFMKDTTDEDLKSGILELRDKYIPWVLTGQMPIDVIEVTQPKEIEAVSDANPSQE